MPTHLAPIVPLAWALRSAGHEVLVACQPDVVAMARQAGFSVAVIGDAYDDVGRRRRQAPPTDAAPHKRVAGPPWPKLARGWRERLDRVLDPCLTVARRWRPDLIVADPLELAAPLVAGELGIGYVHHRWGVDALGDERWRQAERALSDVSGARSDGLPPPSVVLDPCPPGLQAPDLSQGAGIRFVPFNGSGSRPGLAPPRGTRICVCFGTRTVALGGADVVRRTLRALTGPGAPGEVVVAGIGAELGELPDGVRALDSVPLNLFLSECSLVVHHGGAGTTLTATSFGLPQLVLPQAPYLVEHGQRLADRGAGTMLSDREQCEADISGAVADLLSRPGAASAARELAKEMAAMPSPGSWVAPLEELAGRARG
ncbi:nucleotide disphospho-sugar-binding domain-containing protein [Streptomyces albiflavescens]|uniref:nucleotide disphospho-sugar-binding domain-containing protein n=1 Tax=Streptomyces albiflavescens TaxID=1623582 RepID=UPI0016647F60|nr:nucleotide disphospho-sugar-binding domain-containing protein [Streptomyces albiflavescens]